MRRVLVAFVLFVAAASAVKHFGKTNATFQIAINCANGRTLCDTYEKQLLLCSPHSFVNYGVQLLDGPEEFYNASLFIDIHTINTRFVAIPFAPHNPREQCVRTQSTLAIIGVWLCGYTCEPSNRMSSDLADHVAATTDAFALTVGRDNFDLVELILEHAPRIMTLIH